jgi:hypothetical protein
MVAAPLDIASFFENGKGVFRHFLYLPALFLRIRS